MRVLIRIAPMQISLQLRSLCATGLVIPALVACTSEINPIDPPDTDPLDAAGIYTGKFRLSGEEDPIDVTVLVAEMRTARAVMFSDNPPFIASGLYDASQGAIDWNARLFEEAVVTPDDEECAEDDPARVQMGDAGLQLDDCALTTWSSTGQHTRDEGFSVNLVTADGRTGSVQVDYVPARYDKFSRLVDVSGIWEERDDFGSPTATFTIDANGQMSGQDELCTYSGNLTQPNALFNLYDIRFDVQCDGPDAQTVEGLATVAETEEGEDLLEIAAASSRLAVVIRIERAR